MKPLQYILLSTSLCLALTACGGKDSKGDGADTIPDSTNVPVENVPKWVDADTTVYGAADGFGQSALTFITTDGRELDLALSTGEANDQLAIVYGDREDTARYALTIRSDGETVGTMLNISQLEHFLRPAEYEIHNCHLVLKLNGSAELVTIKKLTDHEFLAVGVSGKEYHLKK